MNRTLKLISVLLSYPEPNLSTVREEFHAAVAADSLLPRGDRVLLDTLIDELCGLDTLEAQERYVRLFDRTRSLSLHLFEHVHGESRDAVRGLIDAAIAGAGLAAYHPRVLFSTRRYKQTGARRFRDALPAA